MCSRMVHLDSGGHVGWTDYSQVDTLRSQYKSVNFGAHQISEPKQAETELGSAGS